ncbi:MAG: DUF4167 domain-containing protein [Hyphomonadaceae bacterium]|nr:DUF4167 domain-containing protein [Hyphomonadaceae bacterium]
MKRQRGRGRKPGGGGGGSGGGGNNHNHGNRSLESSGPDVKIRGTAAQIYEKYAQYARDAQSGGDRVKYEALLQHAEHYYRVMAASMPRDRLLAQQNGEGGMQQGQQPGDGVSVQHSDIGMQQHGDSQDSLKVMDDQSNDADDGDDDGDSDGGGNNNNNTNESAERDEVEASGGQQDDQQGNTEGAGRGRRRRGRRRPDGDRPNAPGGGGNGGGADPEARSALDSLARKQGALTGG